MNSKRGSRNRSGALVLTVGALLAAADWPLTAASPSGPPGAGQESPKDPLIQELYGTDQRSTLAARDILLAILQEKEPKAGEYRQFLDQVLDPGKLSSRQADPAVAEKLIGAIGYLATTENSFPGGPDRILPLIGVGSESLRRVVREALLNFIASERQVEPGGKSATFQKLGDRIRTNSPPSRGALSDIAGILWRIDGKALVGFLIEGLARNRDHPGLAVYIQELRDRLQIDFQTPAAWEAWWNENRAKNLETILLESRKAFTDRRIDLWKKNFQRIKDSANPERYLGALVETFEQDFTREMRVAVLGELGAFPVWLRDTRFPGEIPGIGPLDAAGKDEFLARGVDFLLKVLRGANSFRYVSLEVGRETLAALGMFQAFIDRKPELQQGITDLVLSGLRGSLRMTPGGSAPEGEPGAWDEVNRQYALELIRISGTLRITDPLVRAYLESILKMENPAAGEDAELLTAAVTAAGRILERRSSTDAVEQLLNLYDRCQGRPEKPWRDLRKSCVTALNLPVETADARARVRKLYNGILERTEEKGERIPAIIGLGILAKAGDEESVKALTDILRRREQFEPSEVNGAIDALTYLGDQKALSCFLEFLVAKDRAFGDQIWKKVVSVLKGGKPDLLAWLFSELEQRGFQRDTLDSAGIIVRLAGEQELQDLFTTEKVNLETGESFLWFWQSVMAQLRALELLGQEDEALVHLGRLIEFTVKSEKVKSYRPNAGAELSLIQSRLAAKAKLKSSLKQPAQPIDPEAFRRQILEVVFKDHKQPLERWLDLRWMLSQCQSLKPVPQNALLVDLLITDLSSLDQAELWDGIQKDFRDRYLKALENARDMLKAPPGGAPSNGGA